MQKLIQIIYISRSSFPSSKSSDGIEPSVARILAKSRANNRKKGLVGVLYYGDGCFFQCLEGEEAAVDELYQTLLKDSRHRDLKLLSRRMISQLSFPDWSMKYVGVENEMKRLLAAHGLNKFDPYTFNTEMTHAVMGLLHIAGDPTETTSRPRTVSSASAAATASSQRARSDNSLAKTAMLLSLAALAISILGLLY